MPLFNTRFEAMASPCELQIWHDDELRARRAADAATAEVRRIEAKYSRYRTDSVTTRINAAAASHEIAIDSETAALLGYADQCYRLSEGRFDLTSGVLRRVWDFRRSPPQVPAEADIAAAIARIGWRDVEWNERTVRLPRADMELDFGGIGKEYAADRAAAICRQHDIAHALVNLGGDVRAVGSQHDGSHWRIAIAHPRLNDAVVAGIELVDDAVATSGDYERYFEIDGQRYCHLLNARTGWPVSYWQSVSVVAPLCVVAGSCASIAMLLEQEGETFLRSQGVAYLAVSSDGAIRGPVAQRDRQPGAA
jgi:thiamine biosynthesis lipoprotein